MRVWFLLLATAACIIPLTVLPGSTPTIPDETELLLDGESVEIPLTYYVNSAGTGVLQGSEGLDVEALEDLFKRLEELSPGLPPSSPK